MENAEGKGSLFGEIISIVILQWIMILFRLVEPINWPVSFPRQYINAGNEFVYFGIELCLDIIIVAHFIFKISFKELGLVNIKENIASLIVNLTYLGGCIGVAYLLSQFSKNIEVPSLKSAIQIVTNFIAIAFIRELIFRGFLFRAFLKLFNDKGIIASVLSAVCFTVTYLPSILVSINEVSGYAILQSLVIPFALGLYLSLVYYYGRNIWICTIIHGVLISFQCLSQDFIMMALEAIYIGGLLIYLLYKLIMFYKNDGIKQMYQEDEFEKDEHDYNYDSEEDNHIEDTVAVKNERVNVDYETHRGEFESVTSKVGETKNKEIPVTVPTKLVELKEDFRFIEELGKTIKAKREEEPHHEAQKQVCIPTFKSNVMTPSEKIHRNIEKALEEAPFMEKDDSLPVPKLFDVLSESYKEDLGKVATNLNTKEELSKVVHLDTRKQKAEEMEKIHKDFEKKPIEDTLVMPALTKEKIKEVEQEERIRDKEVFAQSEPNYIMYLESILGEFEAIYKKIVPSDVPIDILYFKGNIVDAIVTNGMRKLAMNVPLELKEYRNIELMMFVDKSFDLSNEGLLKNENAWLMKILSDLAVYPYMTNSYLGWGHIVGNGEDLEAYDESVDYCGALVYPPIDQENVEFCRYNENGVNIIIYNIMPLYRDELKFIQEQSAEQFINLIASMGIKQCVTKWRENAIKAMNLV